MSLRIPSPDRVGPLLDAHHHELAEEIRRFVAAEIAPLGHPRDDEDGRRQARTIVRLIGAAGLVDLALPSAVGSRSGTPDFRACCLVREGLAAVSPLADAMYAIQCLASTPLTLAGSDELQQEWLPRVARGEAIGAFAMTEPEAGTDVGSLTTSARREGDHYVLEGAKTLISNAGIADYYLVFARTGPEAGTRGISAILVSADTAGLSWEAQVMSAPHPLGTVRFDGCRVPASNRLGAEGEGFKVGMKTLDRLRPTVAAAACGMAGGALRESVRFVQERRQFGQPLSELQLIQHGLAAMEIELEAARLLVYRAAWATDTGQARVTREAARAKAFATEAAQRIVDRAVQMHGGRGVLADSNVDLFYRAVRALRIYEGTTEIQHLIIARHLLEEGRP